MEEEEEKQPPPVKPLSPQEWETLMDDYQYTGVSSSGNTQRWISSNYSGLPLFSLSLSTILNNNNFSINLKCHLILFLEQNHHHIFFSSQRDHIALARTRLLDSLALLLPSPVDGVSLSYSLKEQFILSTVSIFITTTTTTYYHNNSNNIDEDNSLVDDDIHQLETLIELLLTVINRPNHGPDRQTRAVACECLRQLEIFHPCLLSGIGAHLWGMCQAERTHASQSYVLLFATVVRNIVALRPPNLSLTNTSHPLVPFNYSRFHGDNDTYNGGGDDISSYGSYKELRRAVSFLLECPQLFASGGMLEFVFLIMPVSDALELQASLLKVQFSGLLYVCDPLMCHAFLTMYLRFVDAFRGHEGEVARRLVLMSSENQHHLVFRLLALHWLLGLLSDGKGVKGVVVEAVPGFYPSVFDPLALKSLKIDLLALCSNLLSSEKEELYLSNLFEDGVVSVSAFKWLPRWSTETAVAFRTFHKYVIGTSSHVDSDPSSTRTLMKSPIFKTIQRLLVELTLEYKGLVPVTLSFIDRLLGCDKHCWLGERLLQTFDELLLPKLERDYYRLPSYFPILERIAENDTIPPGGVIELLTKFVTFLVAKHGPETGLKSWSQGSKVLGICRIMLMHHHSSRLFLGLSRLFAFTCLYFPDLEVRDDARIYLRMLICIPGKKLRRILLSGDQPPGIAPAPQSNSYFNGQSQPSPDVRISKTVSSYIHILRVIPLLVKQSWSLSLSTLNVGVDKPASLGSIGDDEPSTEQKEYVEGGGDIVTQINLMTKKIDFPKEPLRVMDLKVSEVIGLLRRHFSTIPDFRQMSGLKIQIPCNLHFKSEPFNRIWGLKLSDNKLDGSHTLVALYAVVLKFSASAPYGSIPPQHIPFLVGESEMKDNPLGGDYSLGIVPVGSTKIMKDGYLKANATIKLEPKEPVPGLVDVYIEANTENGEIIRGQLQSIDIGIEDMFLKATIPSDVSNDEIPRYYLNLFEALWEACGSSTYTGHETFPLKGGKGVAAISGTRSVKLIEVPVTYLIQSIEQYLAPFVVSVVGDPLLDIVKEGEIIKDVVWKGSSSGFALDDDAVCNTNLDRGPLYLKYVEEDDERGNHVYVSKRSMGIFQILIFLPPRFHLLLQMEVSDVSTLVRIRTDHWPCLAYIDDYLEALFS